MKNHVSCTAQIGGNRLCKTLLLKYDDAFMLVVTDRDSLGTLVEVERGLEGEDEEIDVRTISGAGDRAESQMELARAIAEIVLFGEWTGNKKDKWIKISRAKKILISVCLNKEEGAEEEQVLKKESTKAILASIKSLLNEHQSFLFD